MCAASMPRAGGWPPTAFTLFALVLAVGRLSATGSWRAWAASGSCKAAAQSPRPAAAWRSWRRPRRCASRGGRCSASGSPRWPRPCSAPPRRVSGAPPAVAIAAVTTIGYLGSFTGAPAIGALAEIGSLSAALGLLVAVGALMLLLARPALRERTGDPDAAR